VQRFGQGVAQPYVLLGVLIAHHTGHVRFADTVAPRNSTDGGGTWGAGLAVNLGDRLELGPELRLLGTASDNEINPKLAFWVGLKFGYRF
jgi:hypothetical protein